MSANIVIAVIIACGVAGYLAMSFLIEALRQNPRRPLRSRMEPPRSMPPADDAVAGARRLLGVGPDATSAEVTHRYHELLTLYHPDKTQHLGIELQQLAARKTQEIIEAHELLRSRPPRSTTAPPAA